MYWYQTIQFVCIVLGEQTREPEPARSESAALNLGRRISKGMAGIISKLKSGANNTPPPLENNPIMQYFEVGKESSTAGPGLVWRVHDAYRKSDGKVSLQSIKWISRIKIKISAKRARHYMHKYVLLNLNPTRRQLWGVTIQIFKDNRCYRNIPK